MRLLRLEISGFKSFCDKVSISFVQDGVSIVVGPNGCGKSNIVDAIRWSLGEQSAKHLRGASMEDVIFNGSSARQAVSMAQVTLVFSNPSPESSNKYAEFPEIAVTRRLYRSGESQYLINKTNCRLTDIRELFMDTGIGGKGYSIIEQGKIDQIVTSRPEERRTIIDEAAGIIKFKTKRKEAERKFDATKLNLSRVEDIINELKRQEQTLVTQVKQADEYLEKKARLERLHLCTLATRWYNLKADSDKISNNRLKHQTELGDLETSLSGLDADLATKRLNLTAKESARNEARDLAQIKKEEIIKLESKLESDVAAIENLDEWRKRGDEETDLLTKQIKTIEFQVTAHHKETERLADEIESHQSVAQAAEEKEKERSQALAKIQGKLRTMREEEVDVITRLSKEQNSLVQAEEQLERLDLDTKKHEGEVAILNAEKTACELDLTRIRESLSDKSETRDRTRGKIETFQLSLEENSSELAEMKAALAKLIREKDQAESRIESLNDLITSHEGYDSATKKLLDHLTSHPDIQKSVGFVGTLAELVDPPNMAMPQTNAFLNRYFNLLVFKSYKQLGEIRKIILALDIEQLQLFFLDLNKGESAPQKITWISSRAGVSTPVPLAGTFESINTPIQELPVEQFAGTTGLIDPDAVIMTKAGIFLVGKPGQTNQAEQFFKRQSEVETLENRLDELIDLIDTKEADVDDLTALRNEMTRNLERHQKEVVELDLETLGLRKELDSKSAELDRLSNQLQQNHNETERNQTLRKNLTERQTTLSKSVEQGAEKKEALKTAIVSAQRLLEQTTSDRDGISSEIHQSRVTLASLIEKRNNNSDILARLEGDKKEREHQLSEIQNRSSQTQGKRDWYNAAIKKAKSRLPELLDELNEIENRHNRLKDDIELTTASTTDLEAQIGALKSQMNSITEKSHKLEVRLAQLIQEGTNIADNMFAEHSVYPEDLINTFDVTSFDIHKESVTMTRLKTDIDRMDDVNLAAKKEYDSLKERLDFLVNQSADLNRSLDALELSIEKINQESRRRFKDAFKLINDHFKELFPQLFGGGEAYLELTDTTNLLESGVEIIAKPPGKKLQNMTLLSGGEKALTALALIFAIFQIKPSPFCLLDEVDAPLDEANNVRFNRHVRMLTQNSQFIIITHNKKTMEIGDSLFGVTMEEPGVSKIVSVDFGKVLESA